VSYEIRQRFEKDMVPLLPFVPAHRDKHIVIAPHSKGITSSGATLRSANAEPLRITTPFDDGDSFVLDPKAGTRGRGDRLRNGVKVVGKVARCPTVYGTHGTKAPCAHAGIAESDRIVGGVDNARDYANPRSPRSDPTQDIR
jgi:hypothetical protein